MSVELAQKILAQITEHPESLDQGHYCNLPDCPIQGRCVAAWAATFTGQSTMSVGGSIVLIETLGVDSYEARQMYHGSADYVLGRLRELAEAA